ESQCRLAKKIKWFARRHLTWLRLTQELRGHCTSVSLIQRSAAGCQEVPDTSEVNSADGDQLVDMPVRRFASFVVGQCARRAVVTAVTEFSGDDTGAFRCIPERNSTSNSCTS